MKKILVLLVVLSGVTGAFAHQTDLPTDEMYVCQRCNGSGKDLTRTCQSCQGKGTTTSLHDCYTCGGAGTVKDIYGNDVRCTACDGTGKKIEQGTCPTCGGSGSVRMDCMVCHGTGQVNR